MIPEQDTLNGDFSYDIAPIYSNNGMWTILLDDYFMKKKK